MDVMRDMITVLNTMLTSFLYVLILSLYVPFSSTPPVYC